MNIKLRKDRKLQKPKHMQLRDKQADSLMKGLEWNDEKLSESCLGGGSHLISGFGLNMEQEFRLPIL